MEVIMDDDVQHETFWRNASIGSERYVARSVIEDWQPGGWHGE